MGRVENRQIELEMAAAAFYERKITIKDLCTSALKYAAAVFHNRQSHKKREQGDRPPWIKKS